MKNQNWLIVLFGAALTSLATLAVAQDDVDPSRDIVIWVSPGDVNVPVRGGLNFYGTVSVASPELDQALRNISTAGVAVALPMFGAGDVIATGLSGAPVGVSNYASTFRIRLPIGANLDAAIDYLSRSPAIGHVEKIGRPRFCLPYPNDSLFTMGNQWGLNNYGQAGGSDSADVSAPDAWSISKGSSTLTIGIIDNGVMSWHPDLQERVRSDGDQTWDASSADKGHGFLVAGIAAAKANNRSGISGLTWDGRILSEDITGIGGTNNNNLIIPPALDDAADKGAKVINNSYILIDLAENPDSSWTVGNAVSALYKRGCVIVAAMGNDGDNTRNWPAAYGKTGFYEGMGWGVIAVGATDRYDQRWSDSNRGMHIDVTAPGVDIWSTSAFPPYYESKSGTSLAAPAVSAAAALLLSKDSQLTNDDVERILRYSADDRGTAGWDPDFGAGRINIRRALTLLDPAHLARNVSFETSNDLGHDGQIKFIKFIGVAGFADAVTYCAYRHTIRQHVSFPAGKFLNDQNIRVWGNGMEGITGARPGLSYDLNPNYGMGHWEIVPGSISTSGCTMQTFAYEVVATGSFCSTIPTVWAPTTHNSLRCAWTAIELQSPPTPSVVQSFYVPQAIPAGQGVVEGTLAASNFRACPNNDGGASLFNNARIKVVVRNEAGTPIAGIAAADIQVRLNGGTAAQEFAAEGADSVIANGRVNVSPSCPDVFALEADAPTDPAGVAYITFTGSSPNSPGVGIRNPNRKWGHYDSELPVYVLGTKIAGRLTSTSMNGSYTLQIKNFDFDGGLDAPPPFNQGESVGVSEGNIIANNQGSTNWWWDLDSDGVVGASDFNMITAHTGHDCGTPNTP